MIRRISQFFLTLVSIAALPACAGGYPPAYSAEAIEAMVIDADTKQPLEGVVVTANWELRGGLSPGGSTAVGQLMVMEAITDKNGRFRFYAWGPIRQSKGELHNHDPKLILFKSGYEHRILTNTFRPNAEAALEPVRRSGWNGKTIEIKPFKGTVGEYARRLSFLKTDLGFAYDGQDCEWKRIPLMLVAQHLEKFRFDKEGTFNTLRSVGSVAGQKRCGSAADFFRDYLQ